MMVGDDRAVAETWVMGRRLYEKLWLRRHL